MEIRSALYIYQLSQIVIYKEWEVIGELYDLRQELTYDLKEWDMTYEKALGHLVDFYPDALQVVVYEKN